MKTFFIIWAIGLEKYLVFASGKHFLEGAAQHMPQRAVKFDSAEEARYYLGVHYGEIQGRSQVLFEVKQVYTGMDTVTEI